ncbi:MAG: DUF4249 family protein [Candidatus Kapabacteria bacterium]|nr:DUF4249 family protein [Ignavibacteriota bacterium]MCW5884797.1 DUF4249 family protein [Candidatus Kapabacteria bacterium]
MIKNKFSLLILIFLAGLFINSCEETITGVSLPYKEQIVVRGVIEPNGKFEGIHLTRTLNPLDEYDYNKALVSDAEVNIISDNQSYKLNFNGDVYNNNDIQFLAGKQYQLDVKWKNHNPRASTFIPEQMENVELQYDTTTIYYDFEIRFSEKVIEVFAYIDAKPKNVYITGFLERGFEYFRDFSIYNYNQRDKDGKLKVVFAHFGFSDGMNNYDAIIRMIKNYEYFIDSYDEQYLNYYNTRYNGSMSGGIFGNEGLNIQWNVKGGLGLFIGRNRTIFKFN